MSDRRAFAGLLAWWVVILTAVLFAIPGCQTLSYFTQAARGQWQIVSERQAIDGLVGGTGAAELGERLSTVQEVLVFATHTLMLPGDSSYRTYVELDRKYVVWNVFAAPRLSLVGEQWCYPIVGCAPYRGFFSEADALKLAEKLRASGLDTYVGGVAAYSTLGWFEDSVLSSFVYWPPPDLVRLLIHELAHQRVWVRDDVRFNESYASFVAERGSARWFADKGQGGLLAEARSRRAGVRRWRTLLLAVRDELQIVYAARVPETVRASARDKVYAALQACYLTGIERYGNGSLDDEMARVNNAYLISVSTYDDFQGAFGVLFTESGEQWEGFHAEVQRLGEMSGPERDAALRRLGEQHVAGARDQDHTDQVQCEALSGHGLGRKSLG